MSSLKSRIASLVLAGLLFPAAGHAALFRAYLSSGAQPGADCSLAHPCRYLPEAIAAVASGGEIWMLDSANYNQGQVEIGKSVTILAVPGQVGSISALGNVNAIMISTPGIAVTLRNVAIVNNALNPGSGGVGVVSASSLTIEDSVIAGMAGGGLYAGAGSRVAIVNTVIRDSSFQAVYANSGSVVDVIDCALLGNALGGVWASASSGTTTLVRVTGTAIAAPSDSYSSGILAAATISSTAKIYVTRSTVFGHSNGLRAEGDGTAVIEVSNSMVVRNHANLYITAGGMVRSLGNNHISDPQGTDEGTPTPMPPR